MLIRSYLSTLKRVLKRDRYLIENPASISCDHNLGSAIFALALAHLVLHKPACKLVQVGANSGKSAHDLFDEISKFRLRSLLIEPQADVFNVLKKNYSGMDYVVCVNAAIAPEKASRTIYRLSERANCFQLKGKSFGNGIASFSRDHVWQYFQSHCTPEGRNELPESIIVEFNVQCEQYETLANSYGFGTFDILLVDTEGFDFEILKLINIGERKPRLIKFEHKHLSVGDRREAWEYLKQMKYHQFVIEKTGDTVALLL